MVTNAASKNHHRRQVLSYKRIQFKQWAPETESQSDSIIQWQPVTCPALSASLHKTSRVKEQRPHPRQEEPQPDQHRLPPSPLQKLPCNGTRIDPFHAFPIKDAEDVRSAIDYYIIICSPEFKPGSDMAQHVNPHISLLLPFALQHALVFQSLVAVCRASILICHGKSALEDRAFVHHRSKAIAGLNSKLCSHHEADDVVVNTVMLLMTVEYLLNNQQAVAAHSAGLKQLAAMRGEPSEDTPWNSFVTKGVNAYKSLGAFLTGQPPSIAKDSYGFTEETLTELSLTQPICYPSLPFDPDLCKSLSRLPPGFSEISLSGRLSLQTMRLLAALGATNALSSSVSFEQSRLDSELQTMQTSMQRLSLMKPTLLERYLCCGLLSHCFQLRRLAPLSLFHDPPLRSFVTLLSAHDKSDSKREQDLMVWICVTVAGALGLRIAPMPGGHAVIDRAFELYPNLMRDWDRLEAVLRRFFWTDQIGAHWERCWRLWMNRQNVLRKCGRINEEEGEAGLDAEQLYRHSRGAPRSIMELIKVSNCPFQTQMKGDTLGKSVTAADAGLCPFRSQTASMKSYPGSAASVN